MKSIPVWSIEKLVCDILLHSEVTHKRNGSELLLTQKKLYTFK